MHHFKVTSDPSGRVDQVVVELDGKKLGLVKRFSVVADAEAPYPLVTLQMHAPVDMDVHVPEVHTEEGEQCDDDS